MKYEDSNAQWRNISDITVYYSSDLNIHFTIRDMENIPSDQHSDSEVSNSDVVMTFFTADFVGWEEDDIAYQIPMDSLEIECEFGAESERVEVREESLIKKALSEAQKSDATSEKSSSKQKFESKSCPWMKAKKAANRICGQN